MTVLVSTGILALAWFGAVNLAASGVAWTLSGLCGERVVPTARRSQILVAIRFLPFAASAIVAFVVFAPGHLQLEPVRPDETLGVALYMLAAAAAVLLAQSAWRAAGLVATARRVTIAARVAAPDPKGDWIELPDLGGIALAGLIRPRLLIGTDARRLLTPEELEVAIAHERAHHRSLDNLTRVLIACVPDFFGRTRAAARLERLWDAQAECLADARAAQGCSERATRLAAALVKVARLRSANAEYPLAWSLFHQPALIQTRVRLLVDRGAEPVRESALGRPVLTVAVTAAVVAWYVDLPSALHQVTELLIATLP